jgi:hypothetical protein
MANQTCKLCDLKLIKQPLNDKGLPLSNREQYEKDKINYYNHLRCSKCDKLCYNPCPKDNSGRGLCVKCGGSDENRTQLPKFSRIFEVWSCPVHGLL